MSSLVLEVMHVQQGHKEHRYDPSNPAEVKNTIDMITEKLKKGYTLYGANLGKELQKVADKNTTFQEEKLRELDRFILQEDTRKLLAVPMSGG